MNYSCFCLLKLKSNYIRVGQQKALHMRSLRTFKDDFGVVRKNGEEWLIKMSDTETHIPNVYEEVSHCCYFWEKMDCSRFYSCGLVLLYHLLFV